MTDEVHKAFPGPILLLAGPGTGKTHTLALRIKWLIEEKGVPSDEITVITFTGEAARNMRARISDREKKDVYVVSESQPRTIRTMHSLGHEIISQNPSKCGLKEGFGVLSSKPLRRILLEDAAQLLGFARLVGKQADEARQRASVGVSSQILATVSKYNDILRACNTIDYDDQIELACKLLREDVSLLQSYRTKARNLLVDEYQDINAAQFDLIRLLSEENLSGLFVVGDDDQSIYQFRGGSPTYIREFKSHFGDVARLEYLTLSRRCPPQVLHSALAVVENFNSGRTPKNTPTFKADSQGIVQIHDVPSDFKEAQVAAAITRSAAPSRRVLILTPQALVSKMVRLELHRLRVPYEFTGSIGVGGFDIFPSLKNWLSNPADNLSCRQVVQTIVEGPKIGVPSSRAKKPEKLLIRENALGTIAALWAAVIRDGESLFNELGRESNPKLIADVKALADEIAQSFESDAADFAGAVCRILKPWKKSEALVNEVVTLLEEVRGRDIAADASVKIMTMRMAKGLEADVTIVLGLDEGLFPNEKEDTEEAARLLFVSMTRAKNELHLFHARKREGSASFIKDSFNLKVCSFLEKIPTQYYDRKYIQSDTAKTKKKRKKRG